MSIYLQVKPPYSYSRFVYKEVCSSSVSTYFNTICDTHTYTHMVKIGGASVLLEQPKCLRNWKSVSQIFTKHNFHSGLYYMRRYCLLRLLIANYICLYSCGTYWGVGNIELTARHLDIFSSLMHIKDCRNCNY